MRTLFAAIELCSDDRMIGDAFRQAKIYKVFQTMCPSEYTFVELSLCVHAYIITLHNARCVCVCICSRANTIERACVYSLACRNGCMRSIHCSGGESNRMMLRCCICRIDRRRRCALVVILLQWMCMHVDMIAC